HHPRRLLATIRSRCITVELSPPPLEDAVKAVVTAQPELADNAELEAMVALADGAPGQALHLARIGGLELHGKLKSIIDNLPSLDAGNAHTLAGELANQRAEERFGLFMDMLQAELLRITGEMARAQRGPRALEPWIELWDKVARAYDDTMAFNLDRKQLILTTCFGLEAAARKAAPH
ncbi:MAG: AAA family ATPase, partial [Rhizobiales bacterium]|nr:AAA family ATPase [Hyphomicrobiales bacterium]